MMRLRTALTLLLVVAILLPLMSVQPVAAQEEDPECEAFVARVLDSLSRTCAGLESGMVCYGAEIAEALPIAGLHPGDVFPAGAFDEPGDRLSVLDVARLSTSEFNLDDETWGFALLKVDAYTGMNEETGEPETAELLFVLPGGVTLEGADEPAYDADGNLLLGEVEGDPKVHLAPMQALFLRNVFEDPECSAAIPPVLIVQSEEDEEIDLIVNDATIRLQGTIALEILPTADPNDDPALGDFLRLTTLFGLATLYPDTPNAFLVPPAHRADICLDPPENLGLDLNENDQPVGGDCTWTGPTLLSGEALDRLRPLERLRGNIVIRVIDIAIIIIASGSGGPVIRIIFTDPLVLALAQAACNATPPLLPQAICNLFFP